MSKIATGKITILYDDNLVAVANIIDEDLNITSGYLMRKIEERTGRLKDTWRDETLISDILRWAGVSPREFAMGVIPKEAIIYFMKLKIKNK